MSQDLANSDDVDAADSADAPVELGSPTSDHVPEHTATDSLLAESKPQDAATVSAATTGQRGTGKLSQGLAKGLSTFKGAAQGAAQITKAAASAVGHRIKAKQKTQDMHKSEEKYEVKADKASTHWFPKKQIVYNEGSIKRNVKRVLVTGGAGFIGSHLVDALMLRGYDVICLDNLFSGSKDNVWKWFGNPNFEFIRHDVTWPFFAEVDEIYHLACPASPVFYQNNPIKTLKTNFVGTYNMLGLAKRVKARILLTSTSEVYGDPTEHPQREEYWGNVNNIGIRSCYDEGKRVAESLMMEYWRLHNVNIAIARIFNTYGPRMLENDGRVVSNFIMQSLKGDSLTIYGDGKQTRSFCYIDDQVRGLMSLMESGERGPINIGNPNEYTIKQLAEHTVDLVNEKVFKDSAKEATYETRPLPSDDPKKRRPDITKAKKLLKWEPRIELKEGLNATIDYFVEYLENQKKNANALLARNGQNGGAAIATTKEKESDEQQGMAMDDGDE